MTVSVMARMRLKSFFPGNLLMGMMFILVVTATIERDFSPECREFLYMGTPPVGIESGTLVKICQRYNGKPRYVTLYDTTNRVPLYSAYTFKRSDGMKSVDVPWMYEPQLSTTSETGEMQSFPRHYVHQNFEDAQAVLDDYTNAIDYERGLLNTDEHQAEPDDKAAAYTLTNAVPQVREFNVGSWKAHEHVIRKRLNNYCRGTAYIITGIVPSGNHIRRYNMDRVGIPSYVWSAYCCINYDRNAPYGERYKFPAHAHYGPNEKENNQVLELSIKKLEEFLKKSMVVDKSFRLFVDDCVPPSLALS
ncbi:endonuclease domain-containing 1 protein-like [Alosa sapidissima]|uniref:endonuclease domain-containing 1 protein-like n=1 Tax=Alosa sapidissima TaxID=34773 RepID=UPI001C0869C5|nr:endonuclease domain-containing 1 protein-like [Alosa sapidissima]